MKYKSKDYAIALMEVLAESKTDEKKTSQGFIKLLERQGDLSKAKEIIEITEFLLAKKNGKKSVIFETARRLSENQKNTLLKSTEKGDIVKEKINPELIAGVKIIVDNEKQLDQTMFKKINNLFK
jgi:F0F1-type ATP synthase delta subunit